MLDFDFYRNQFLGEAITEKAFPNLAEQAKAVLGSYERRYILSNGDEISRKMAICAMAEVLQEYHRRCSHTAASVGSVRVQYAAPQESLERRLYRAAATYLDFYRGVG